MKLSWLSVFLVWIAAVPSISQSLLIEGKVVDAATKEPLALASVGVKGKPEEAVSRPDGTFRLQLAETTAGDTLVIRYIGYQPWTGLIGELSPRQEFALKESVTVLDEMIVTTWKFDARDVDRTMRPLKGKLYVMDGEVTNAQYNLFLMWLQDHNQKSALEKRRHDLSAYDKATADYYARYSAPRPTAMRRKDSQTENFDDYPVVNITWESAVAYCEWLTEQYNAFEKRRRFKKVIFRLPTMQEWQIAALGDSKFQSWTLRENFVNVIIPDDTLSMLPRDGQRKRVQVDDQILYPWYQSWHYRNKAQNQRNCWLGNFMIIDPPTRCPANNPSFDGWAMMGRTRSFFPNNIGLYDVVGNVAEMVSEKGKACGGSWNDSPQQSTIQSVKAYERASASVGFRVFMEVVE